MSLAQNEVVLKDQTYDVFTRKEKKSSFLSIEKSTFTTRVRPDALADAISGKPAERNIYWRVMLSLSTTQNIYERESETILNLLGDIGGF